jgi:hypothetical protein
MSDDDLIRDAVHELVAAAPEPKPMPVGGASSSGRYRWLAVAAAVILVIGGIAAIAWSRADDRATPVATTQPPPLPTPPATTVVTTGPEPTSAVTVTAPATIPVTTGSSTPTSTSTTTSTTTTTTSTSTVPPTREQAQVQDYLASLADGRYDDAAVLLREGGLEPEARADLRPLFTEYGDVDDLAARLQSWCANEAICTTPNGPPIDIGGYWLATWPTPGASVTGYYRSGSFEGSPSVGGLPPRRPPASVVPCPTSDVEAVREGDVDGDGTVETIVVTGSGGQQALNTCNTGLSLPALALPAGNVVLGVLQTGTDPAVTLLAGTAGETSSCGATYRLALSAGALIQVGWEGCWGGTGESIGCRDVGGESTIVAYQYTFVDGDRLDNSTGMDVDVLSIDGAPLDSFTLALPEQIEEGFRIVEPYCNGLPVITYG